MLNSLSTDSQPLRAARAGRSAWDWLERLASPKWMLAFFLFAAIAGAVALTRPEWITAAWSVPLAVFAVSILAAIACRPRMRRDAALLGLHVALLALIALVAVARLTYLDGAVTLTEGTHFTGRLASVERGPLHFGAIERLRFSNEGFVEDFADRYRWRATHNRIHWWREGGESGEAEIGDDTPLLIDGYRIYTTLNRGYSPVFHWSPANTSHPEEIGTVQLDAADDFGMANEWQLPGGPHAWVMLDPENPPVMARGEWRRNMGAQELAHRLVVRIADERHVLGPGETLSLPEGRLTYIDLKTWMGYRIVYDVETHWMAAASLAFLACLIAFYARVFSRDVEGGPTVPTAR